MQSICPPVSGVALFVDKKTDVAKTREIVRLAAEHWRPIGAQSVSHVRESALLSNLLTTVTPCKQKRYA